MNHGTKKFIQVVDAVSILGKIVAASTLSVFGLVSAAQAGQLAAPVLLPASKSFNATFNLSVTQGAGSDTGEFKEFRYTKTTTTTLPAALANCTSGTPVPSNGLISIAATTSVSVIACGKTTGNKSSATTATYTLDKTPPTVGVTGPFASDGTTPLVLTYNVSTITFKMTFAGADTIASNSVLASKITLQGSSVANIAVTGSGATERILTLTNVTGDGTATVIVVASGAASDSAGNSSTVTGKTFVLDNTAPTATSMSINDAAAQTNAPAVTLKLAATGASQMYITNTAGCASGGSYETYATSKPWTLGQTNATATVYVKFKDAAGNEGDCISDTIIHDNTKPTFTVSGPSQAYANPSSIVTYTVTYTGATRAITLGPQHITLNSSNHAQGKFASAAIKVTPDPGVGCTPGPCSVAPDPMKKLVALSGFKNNGTLGISIVANSASDWAGNFAGAGTENSATVIVDTGIPTITVGSPSLAIARDASTVTYTITYSGVTDVTLANSHVTLKKTGTANAIFDVSGTGTSGTVTRTVTLSSFTGKGSITLQILKDTASDDAGNKAPAPRASGAFNVDAAIPTIFVGNPSLADAKADSTVTYRVTYSRVSNVTLANSDVVLVKTGTANATYNVTSEEGSGSGTTRTEVRTVTLSGFTGDGTIKIKILRGTASDHVGVFATETTADKTFTVDNAAPGAPLVPASKNFNAAFNVKPTKAIAADSSFKELRYAIASGTSVTAPADCASGSLFVPRMGIPIPAATTSVAVIACDRAGNKSLPTTVTYTLDNVPPTITVSEPSVSEATPATVAVTYTVTYSGADKITLSSANIKREYTGNAWTNLAPTVSMDTAVPPDPMKRIVTLRSFRGTGTLGISISAGTAVDDVGNKAPQLSPSVSPRFNVSSTLGSGTATVLSVSLTSPTGPGRSRAETILSFAVTTSKAITSGLTTQIKLPFKIGATEKLAVYASGSGTSSLIFNYTTGSGDNGLVAWAAGQLRGGTLGAGTGVELNPTFMSGTTSRTIDTTSPAAPSVTANQTFTSGITATIGEGTVISDAKEFRYALDQISILNCTTTASAVIVSAIPPAPRSVPASLNISIPGSFSPLQAIICDTAGNASAVVTRTYNYVPPTPTVTSISPNTGTTAGGTSFTITGTNLTGATAVTIGGIAATNVTVVSATTITAVTSAGGTAGTASVLVTTPGGTNAANTLFTWTIPPPTVTSISPNTGTTAGGTSVTLTGTNLTGATAVTIGGIAATNVTVVNATTITAITSAGGAAGAASVLVTTPGGTNATNTLFTWTTPTPNISAAVAPQNMGVLYGYDGSQPKYNVRVHWDANSNPNFLNYEVAYKISGGAWVTETTRAYQIYSWPGNALYSYNSHGSAMLYKKQFNPGTNYEFRVRSWYRSATPVGEDGDGYPQYPEFSSDWSTTSVSLPATPGALTTAARFKGISYEYRPYRAEQYYSRILINNADTYDATLSVLPVVDRFNRGTNYQYREYRTPDQIQLGWTTLNPSDSFCLPDFTCLVVRNLSPSKTYEVRMQTWFKSSTLVDNGDYMYYPDNPTAPEWVTTTVTTPASLVGGGAPSNFSVASTTRLDDENYELRTYNLSWATPSTTTNSSWIVLWYEIQTASSFYGHTEDYEIATLSAPPRGDLVPTVQLYGSNSFSIGEFDHMRHNSFRVRAVYGYLTTDYDCDGLCFRVPKEYSPWAYVVQ